MGHQTLLNIVPELILITDSRCLDGEAFFAAVESALTGGVDAVLVREKEMDSARLLAFSSRLRALTRQYEARLIIHTQADVALAVDADGVHVSAADIRAMPQIRRWLQENGVEAETAARWCLSASCHNADELEQARKAGADFALLSPVFPTASHPEATALGTERFFRLASATSLPVVALGGISPENRCLLAGFPVAAIRALLLADDPEVAARRLSSNQP